MWVDQLTVGVSSPVSETTGRLTRTKTSGCLLMSLHLFSRVRATVCVSQWSSSVSLANDLSVDRTEFNCFRLESS